MSHARPAHPAFWVQFRPATGMNRAQNPRSSATSAFRVQFRPAVSMNRDQYAVEVGG